MRCTNENILRALDLSQELMILADKGDADREDESCGVLYGVIRDAAFKIRAGAEKEKEKHEKSGKWD